MNFEDLAFLFTSSTANRGLCRLDFDEAACVYKHVKYLALNNSNIQGIEIGRAAGGSTILILSAFLEGKGFLISLDNKPTNDILLTERLSKLKLLPLVHLVKMDSRFYTTKMEFNFAFIDGDHSYEATKRDYEKFGSKVKPGGYIIFHDMGQSRPNAEFDKRLFPLYRELIKDKSIEVLDEQGSIVVFKKL